MNIWDLKFVQFAAARLVSIFLVLIIGACSSSIVAIHNVTVVSGGDSQALGDAIVVIDGDTIVAVGRDVSIPAKARLVDGSDKYIIPGLWDMHVHTSKSRGSSLRLFVANGVTSVRDLGGDVGQLTTWRVEIDQGIRIGPTMYLAGSYLESPENVARMRTTPVSEMVEPVERTRVPVGSPEDAQRVVQDLAAQGVDVIKVRTFHDLMTYRSIGRAARQAGLQFAGHITGLNPEQVLGINLNTIEHFFFPALNDMPKAERMAHFNEFANRGVAVVPTLGSAQNLLSRSRAELQTFLEDEGQHDYRRRYVSKYLELDWAEQFGELEPQMVDMFRAAYESALRDLREMHASGMHILAGSDVGVFGQLPGWSLHDELKYLVTMIGMTPTQALERATQLPAMTMRVADTVGMIEPGKRADLVLLNADPRTDVANTQSIDAVILRGQYFNREALDALLESVASDEDIQSNDWPRAAPNEKQ